VVTDIERAGRSWFSCAPMLVLLMASQLASPAVAQPLDFRTLSLADGLSQSSVYAIVQDRDGFLWIGTEDGLNRYDGYRFQVYKNDPNDTSSLSDSHIHALLLDHDDVLYVGTYGGGLNRFDRDANRFDRFFFEKGQDGGISHNTVTSLVEDVDGGIWVATLGGGLNYFDPERGTFLAHQHDPDDPSSLSANEVWCLSLDSKGALWVGTLNGLNRLSPAEREKARSAKARFVRVMPHERDGGLADEGIRCVLEDRSSEIWVGTFEGGLFRLLSKEVERLPGESYRFAHYAPEPGPDLDWDGDIRSVFEDDHGNFWVGTDGGGLFRLDRGTGEFQRFVHRPEDKNSISSDRIWCFYQDKSSIIWIGTFVGGLNKLDLRASQFRLDRYKMRLLHESGIDFVKAILVDAKGSLWIGTNRGLFKLPSRDSQEPAARYWEGGDGPYYLQTDYIRALAPHPDGSLMVGTWGGGLAKLNEESHQVRWYRHDPEAESSLSHDYVRCVILDSRDRVWVGTSAGLNRMLDEGRFKRYFFAEQGAGHYSANRISSIMEDRDGVLWLGTELGFVRFETGPGLAEIWSHGIGDVESVSNDKARPLYQDEQGYLWIGTTGGGLDRFDPETETFLHLTEAEGLPNNVVYAIEPDTDGFLWLSTNRGLARMDPEHLSFRLYDEADGLQSNEFNLGASFSDTQGLLYFGGINGINIFDPSQLGENRYIPQTRITGIRVGFGERGWVRNLSDGQRLKLSHRENSFELAFVALDFTNPHKNQFAYQMRGLDDQWYEIGTRNRAIFSHLPPGEYHFRVKGSNNDGVWSDSVASLELVVVPPWWRTPLANAGFAILAIGIIVILVALFFAQKARRQRNMLRRKERELEAQAQINARLSEIDHLKDQFLANTSHELRTPLNGIIGIVESLIDGVSGDLPDMTVSNLTIVLSSARRLAHLVNDLLDYSALKESGIELVCRPVDMRAVVDVVLSLSTPLASSKSIQLHNRVEPDLPPVWGDHDRIQQILHNLIGNAVKFTERGSVSVTARVERDEVAIMVEDTGCGISPERLAHVFESYEQGDDVSTRRYSGTGLGLAITKQLIELHGGTIKVESVVDEGSRFEFRLPLANEAQLDQFEVLSEQRLAKIDFQSAQPKADPTEDGHHILVVDDEPINLQVIVNILTLQGYQVTKALSGAHATRLVRSEGFDLVLLDVMMPGMSGFEVCRQIRKHFTDEELPVVFLTAKNQITDMTKGFEAGGNDYLIKPVSRDELLPRVKTLIAMVEMRNRLDQAREQLSAVEIDKEKARLTRSVLHNIANVLNSLRISCQQTRSAVVNSKIDQVRKTAKLIGEQDDVTGFLRSPRGQLLPAYLERLADMLEAESLFISKEIDNISRKSDMMLGIIDTQQRLAKSDSSHLEVFELDDLLQEALNLYRPSLDKQHVRVETVKNGDLRVKAHRLHTLHVLINLFKNAVEAMTDNEDNQREIKLRSYRGGERFGVISVSDNGMGLSPEELDQVFNYGFTTKNGGHGLGLHYCRRVLSEMGGGIEIFSAGRGKGATFRVRLPVAG